MQGIHSHVNSAAAFVIHNWRICSILGMLIRYLSGRQSELLNCYLSSEINLQGFDMASQTPDVPPEEWWSKATVAVVTGSNKGLGQAIVLELARRGVTVVATARNVALGRDALDAARHAEPALADLLHFHQLDVTDEQSVAQLAAWLRTTFGGIDILINNAGVSKRRLEVYEDAAETMAVNFWGARSVTEVLLPLLRASPAGARIVMIASQVSLMKHYASHEYVKAMVHKAVEHQDVSVVDSLATKYLDDVRDGRAIAENWTAPHHYKESKLCLNTYTRILAAKLANRCEGQRVLVNALCPGLVESDMVKAAFANSNPGVFQQLVSTYGMLTPAEAAMAPVWLALLPIYDCPHGQLFIKQQRCNTF